MDGHSSSLVIPHLTIDSYRFMYMVSMSVRCWGKYCIKSRVRLNGLRVDVKTVSGGSIFFLTLILLAYPTSQVIAGLTRSDIY